MMCLMAALREEETANRTKAAQMRFIVDDQPDTLPLAPVTVRTAHRCGDRWTVGEYGLGFSSSQDSYG